MRVLLISANWENINMPPLPLGLACVGAATRRAGHEVQLLDLMFAPDHAAAVREAFNDFQPGVIGIAVRNIDDQKMESARFLLDNAKEVVTLCREFSNAPIVLGGAGYSMFPASSLRYLGADIGIQGDGEVAFPALVERIAAGSHDLRLPGLWLPTGYNGTTEFPTTLDELPLPEPQFWISPSASPEKLFIPVQSRRGCPMGCSYCSTNVIQGSARRNRSPEGVVNGLRLLRDSGYRNIAFVDNNFNLPSAYAKELCRSIVQADLGLNLWCIVYPKWVDAELVDLMRQAGCREVALGFENGSETMLRNFNKRFSLTEVRAISRLFAEAGIPRRGFLMLGGPGETRQSVEESFEFADSLQLNALSVTVGIRIYPDTPLRMTAIADAIIGPDDDLLAPRFYMTPQLRDWLPQRVAEYKSSRPWVQ